MNKNTEIFNEFNERTKRYEEIYNSYKEMNPLENLFRIITNEDKGDMYCRISTDLLNEARNMKIFIKYYKLDTLLKDASALYNVLDEVIQNVITGRIMAERFVKVINENTGFKDGKMEDITYKANESSIVLTKTIIEIDEVYRILNEYYEIVNCHPVEEVELKIFDDYIYHLQDCTNKINRLSREMQKNQCCDISFIHDLVSDFVDGLETNEIAMKMVHELLEEKKKYIKRTV